MTLVLGVMGRSSIWMLVDRRLSSPGREPRRDDAVKLLNLDSVDAVALIGYAGLGATAVGTEPSTWMSGVLRGRNLSLEQYLTVLAEVASRELPRHLTGLSDRSHAIVACAIVQNEPRVYVINVIITDDGRTLYRCVRFFTPRGRTPRFALGGSGTEALEPDRWGWRRELLRLVDAYERNRIQPRVVADYLAALNNRTHEYMLERDRSVGPRCIVVWRAPDRGGGHQFYSGFDREEDSGSFPTISRGTDIRAIAEIMMPHFIEAIEREGSLEIDMDRANAELAELPETPDERLD